MIIDKIDATNNPDAKISPSFKRLVKSFNWIDSFRSIHPTSIKFSRYYTNAKCEGASRIDHCYHYGEIKVSKAEYLPLAFSDPHAHVVSICLPNPFPRLMNPRSKPLFRIKAEVVKDTIFQEQLSEARS